MQERLYNGFRRLDFTFEGREAVLVFPEQANENKNWLLKTEYFDAFPDLQIELVKMGYHLFHIQVFALYFQDE